MSVEEFEATNIGSKFREYIPIEDGSPVVTTRVLRLVAPAEDMKTRNTLYEQLKEWLDLPNYCHTLTISISAKKPTQVVAEYYYYEHVAKTTGIPPLNQQ